MEKWLSIVGLGEDGLGGLTDEARRLVDGAEVLVGGDRHLAMVPEGGQERIGWRTPLESVVAEIEGFKGRPVCVLATGDPMFFGIGVTLARRVPLAEMTIIPATSAFSLACARLGWPLAEVETLTLHGRPLELIHGYLQPRARLLILSHDGGSPEQVAQALCRRDYGRSRMWVFERMGGEQERVLEATAEAWRAGRTVDLNTIAVECAAGPAAGFQPRVPGLPDDAYTHDGQLTKREVRSATLAVLGPAPGHLLWDVGAGCGSIAIEWMRACPRARAIAIERNADRVRLIESNAASLGVPQLEIVAGEAPAALARLDAPDAVFIGGGAAAEALFDACWQALGPGGRLAANVVTIEGEQALSRWRERIGGDLTRIAVSRASPVGSFTGWRPQMAVTQFSAVKP